MNCRFHCFALPSNGRVAEKLDKQSEQKNIPSPQEIRLPNAVPTMSAEDSKHKSPTSTSVPLRCCIAIISP